MKTNHWQIILAAVVAIGVATGSTARAQTLMDTNVSVPSAPPAQPQPQLAYGVPQIVQLTQAKIGDGTIIAYIKNSGASYNLDANQIIYLRQQGVSDAVITMMLNQPRAGGSSPTPPPAPYASSQPSTTSAAPSPSYSYAPPSDSTSSSTVVPATTAPAVTYVQAAPATTTYYYSSPYYYPAYDYYPGYYYPPVSLSLGWGWGWGGGWHGGWGGGWHGGGGFHGGGFHR